jgi:hypothetical protein
MERISGPQRHAILAANGEVTQARTFVYASTSYTTVTPPALWLASPDPCEPEPDPEPSPNCPAQYQARIDAHGDDALSAGDLLGTSGDDAVQTEVLGLSALESGWGGAGLQGPGISDYFNLEKTKTKKNPNPALLPYSTGWAAALGNPNVLVAKLSSYLNSALSFAAVDGRYVYGVTDSNEFANILHSQAGFGIGQANFVGRWCR